ncbi:hypothetical protein CgunFtcFv8_025551 [Champsocephalus gunnari]|uniref:Uncharacterized protein n=1 Tax=Champsocephalus gunnari TaxID=52237 RepID=A0AAN8CEI8_CHAGU|nr:hypothetical protein CgunFtcFv8_025551 [Champsocephalus gunnari]
MDLTQLRWKIDRLLATVCVQEPSMTPGAVELDSMTLQSYIDKQVWTTELKEEMGLCSRSLFGMEPSQMSFLFFLMFAAAATGSAGEHSRLCTRAKDKWRHPAAFSVSGRTRRVQERTTGLCCDGHMAGCRGRDRHLPPSLGSKDPLPASPAQPVRIPYPEHAGGPHDKMHINIPDGE